MKFLSWSYFFQASEVDLVKLQVSNWEVSKEFYRNFQNFQSPQESYKIYQLKC